jgi:hypothetical protein
MQESKKKRNLIHIFIQRRFRTAAHRARQTVGFCAAVARDAPPPGRRVARRAAGRGGMFARTLFAKRTVLALAEAATQTALAEVVAISHPVTVIT